MGLIRQRRTFADALTACAVACVLALQLLTAGLAFGASPASFSDSFICAQSPPSDSSKGAPDGTAHRHHPACCILHHAAFDATTSRVVYAIAIPAPFGETSSYFNNADVLRFWPELAPLSARAPPFVI